MEKSTSESPDGVSVIICGVSKGAKKAYACQCCHYESDNIEAFATSMCWPCVAGNLLCERCVEDGVPIDRFSSRRGRLHRFSRWKYEQSYSCPAVTNCGLEIERGNIGQAVAVRRRCLHCWPE